MLEARKSARLDEMTQMEDNHECLWDLSVQATAPDRKLEVALERGFELSTGAENGQTRA